MKRYHRKPLRVKAEQVTEDNIKQLTGYILLNGGEAYQEKDGIDIHVGAGYVKACIGTWVVQMPDGSFEIWTDALFTGLFVAG